MLLDFVDFILPIKINQKTILFNGFLIMLKWLYNHIQVSSLLKT